MSLLTDDDRYELTLNSEGSKPMNMREMPDRVEARDLQEAEPRLWRKAKTWFIVLLKNLTELHKIILRSA